MMCAQNLVVSDHVLFLGEKVYFVNPNNCSLGYCTKLFVQKTILSEMGKDKRSYLLYLRLLSLSRLLEYGDLLRDRDLLRERLRDRSLTKPYMVRPDRLCAGAALPLLVLALNPNPECPCDCDCCRLELSVSQREVDFLFR